jgi:hypothetical protein
VRRTPAKGRQQQRIIGQQLLCGVAAKLLLGCHTGRELLLDDMLLLTSFGCCSPPECIGGSAAVCASVSHSQIALTMCSISAWPSNWRPSAKNLSNSCCCVIWSFSNSTQAVGCFAASSSCAVQQVHMQAGQQELETVMSRLAVMQIPRLMQQIP